MLDADLETGCGGLLVSSGLSEGNKQLGSSGNAVT
jgi:hypothetical protein